MKLNSAVQGLLASALAIGALSPAAAGADSAAAPATLDCNPLALAPTAGARVSETAAAAGVVEPNAEEAYRAALESGAAPATRRARATGTVRVPVHVHVVQDSAGVGVIPPTRIAQQITILNNSFGGTTGGDNTGITFELIDTDVTINPAWSPLEVDTPAETAMKTALREGGARALNLYIVDLSTLLGWATFPGDYAGAPVMDGVVVDNDTPPGGSAPYGEGDTATHEVGHWLGLFHTFEGGCGPPGDFVDDTEPDFMEDYDCPAINTCDLLDGQNDPVDNFMSYSDDSCMHRFTPGQGNRMHDETARFRNGAPTATGQSVSTAGDIVAVNVAAGDPDGDALTYTVSRPPEHGTVGGSGATLTYNPKAGYAGKDSFEVQVADVFGASVKAPVSVAVDGLDLKAKAKQKLSKLSVSGSCGSGACSLTATGKIAASGPSGGRVALAKRTFKLRKAKGNAQPNASATLKLKLAKSKQRQLLKLLKSGWTAKAKVSVSATGATGNAKQQTVTITVKP